tara:strand:+ start:437 stop:640 length:204 start_codon:yes stop_codon:yes gene_type:complete
MLITGIASAGRTSENTLRQYRLRDEGAMKSIDTPAFLVNGQEWRGWFQGRSIDEAQSFDALWRVTAD